jgi:predicted nuclease with TOPRIM domain
MADQRLLDEEARIRAEVQEQLNRVEKERSRLEEARRRVSHNN